LREFAEETGILISADGPVPVPAVRDVGYYQWLEEHALAAAEDDLVLVSRWVTPEFAQRRFDTRFYVVPAPTLPK
jgi:8-oxo-dGTP pyrophosphatase MutT (NUDIX family)